MPAAPIPDIGTRNLTMEGQAVRTRSINSSPVLHCIIPLCPPRNESALGQAAISLK